jgi:predicted GIY-YIG superfamily endonuclease
MSMSKTNIYILKLTDNKYYVGKSKDPEKRFMEHVNGDGSTWTAKYEPIEILKVIKDASPFDEDKFVKEYMSKFGIKNVRGGSYVKEALDEIELYNLKKEIWGATDCCTQCGRKGHFVKDCYYTTDIDGDSLFVWGCEKCEKEFVSEQECAKHEKTCIKKITIEPKKVYYNKVETFNCQYCNKEFETQKGATFHENVHCKEKYQVETFNCQYCDKEFETQKGATFHENVHCKASKPKTIKIESGMKKMNNFVKYAGGGSGGGGNNKCYRCGRSGHYSSDCYARTHVGGYGIDSDTDSD